MKTLNIIIPAYNEEKRLPKCLEALNTYLDNLPKENPKLASEVEFKVYVIDDGSTDGTRQVAGDSLAKSRLPGAVLFKNENMGKGAAVQRGMLESPEADYYFFADADLASPWTVLGKIYGELQEYGTDAAIGSRQVVGSAVKTSLLRKIPGRIANLMIRIMLGINYEDTQCGYKLFSKACLPAFRAQTIMRWGFDFEILYLIKRLGLKVREVGVKWENKEGSKVKFTDYFRTFEELLRIRLNRYTLQ